MNHQIVLFGVRIFFRRRETRRQKHMLALAYETVSNPQRAQLNHLRGFEPELFLQLAARQLLGIFDLSLPSALGQLERPLLNGVTELFHKPDVPVIDGQNDGAVGLFDHAVDALLAVGAQDLVFAHAHPAVAVDLAA
jgi:hypothetical protein